MLQSAQNTHSSCIVHFGFAFVCDYLFILHQLSRFCRHIKETLRRRIKNDRFFFFCHEVLLFLLRFCMLFAMIFIRCMIFVLICCWMLRLKLPVHGASFCYFLLSRALVVNRKSRGVVRASLRVTVDNKWPRPSEPMRNVFVPPCCACFCLGCPSLVNLC